MIGNASYHDSSINSIWIRDFRIQAWVVATEIGLCRTVNFCDLNNYLVDDLADDRLFKFSYASYNLEYVPENQTQPYMTNSLKSGFQVMAYYGHNEIEQKGTFIKPFVLMIHSPFEWPTRENQQFLMAGHDFNRFSITPQLNKIDDTMSGMEPHE